MSGGDAVRWYCTNRDCNWSFVGTTAIEGQAPPRCVCGRTMRRGDVIPALHYLDFLREDVSQEKVLGAEKE